MEKRVNKILLLIIIIVYAALLVFSAVVYTGSIIPSAKQSHSVTLSQAELLTADGGAWTKLELPEYFTVNYGEMARLRFRLDYQFNDNSIPCLIFQANHDFMDFYLDGEKIYSIPQREHTVGNYYVCIPMPRSADGQVLEIDVTVPRGCVSRIQMPAVKLTDEATYIRELVVKDCIPMLLNFLIITSGLCIIVGSLLNRRSERFWTFLAQGIAALNLGIYFTCEMPLFSYLFPNALVIYYFDMISFALLVVSVIMLFCHEMIGICKKVISIVAMAGVLNAFVQLILEITNAAQLRPMLTITHILQLISIIIVIICVLYDLVRRREAKTRFMLLAISVGGILDMLIFFTEVNMGRNIFFVKIAIIVCMIVQLVDSARKFTETLRNTTKEKYFEHMALKDTLTGCYSRMAYELDRAEKKKSKPFMVFSFDLNDLKKANDWYGHEEGDNLLKCFSEVLHKTFDRYGKCYRTGGDEFVVLCESISAETAKALLEKMKDEARMLNQADKLRLNLSYASGVCSTEETGGNLEDAVFASDERMYENKRIMKASFNI